MTNHLCPTNGAIKFLILLISQLRDAIYHETDNASESERDDQKHHEQCHLHRVAVIPATAIRGLLRAIVAMVSRVAIAVGLLCFSIVRAVSM